MISQQLFIKILIYVWPELEMGIRRKAYAKKWVVALSLQLNAGESHCMLILMRTSSPAEAREVQKERKARG